MVLVASDWATAGATGGRTTAWAGAAWVQPVGSVCTVVARMYAQAGVPIPAPIAGGMLCAILSDTVIFKSPATTGEDRATAATLTAPSDGLIVAVNVLPGVNAPTSGYAIEESVGPMVANAAFAESVIAGLQVGQSATVSVTGAAVSVPGTLTQIVPVASSSSGASSVATYAVTVTLTSPPATVLAGMSATVTVTTASVDNALRVPTTALQGSATAGYSVLVMNSDGSTTSRTVQVGLVTTSMAQITNGLADGDTVVTGTASNKNSTTTTAGGAGGINPLTGGGGLTGGFGR